MSIPYLDNAATTPVDPRVIPAMMQMLGPAGTFANPASTAHASGREASARVEEARGQVAALLRADPREIIFTSGATEADNLALKGLAEAHPGGHLVISTIEHKAVLDPASHLQQHGYTVTRIAPGTNGQVDPQAVLAAVRPDTFLVSVMHANNETGVINDIASIGAGCRERGVAFHTDAAQTAGKLELDTGKLCADLISISGHKLYAPKGIGVLYMRRRAGLPLVPQIHGGGHERGWRSGTLATHQIVGLGLACELAGKDRETDNARIETLRDRLWKGISGLGGIDLNGGEAPRLPGHLNVTVHGVNGEVLLTAAGAIMAVSGASACLSATFTPSYVLTAMGRSADEAQASIRFSLGRFTTARDVETAIAGFGQIVNGLR